MKKHLILILTIIFSTNLAFASDLFDKVIYGEDNRVDVYDSKNPLFVELAKSTAAMISVSQITANEDGTFKISAPDLRSRGMCSTERFLAQPTAANCSGFIVGGDILVTAGHCIRSDYDCKRYKWVFDFKMEDEAHMAQSFPADNIYACKELIKSELDSWNSKNDYAVIKLDRVVAGRAPLTFRKESRVTVGDPLVVIGHPTGLPTKIADGASVRSIEETEPFFVANLDTYGGNSGSAVFNAQSGVVEGILVRGETDYVPQGNCRVSKVCKDNECRGEDVTKITAVKEIQ